MTNEPLVVIGIGQDGPAGLGPEARAHLESAQILVGGKRHLAFFPGFAGERLVLEGPPAGWIEKLKACDRRRKIVILSTGDPLYYGIGRLLLDAFPKAELLFLPQVSSVALAFARLKETWNDATVVSLHGRPLHALLPALQRRDPKIAILTDAVNHPAAIARLACENGLADYYLLWVCENLGSSQERLSPWAPQELEGLVFAPLNLVVLLAAASEQAIAKGSSLPLLGLPDSAIGHRGDLITSREVRLAALCYLELHAGEVMWDVGAGSGSVSLEAARLSPGLQIFAIDRAPDYLLENVERLGLTNVLPIIGEAPEILAGLPDPDAVFIGGSGGRLAPILECVARRLKPGGRLVLSCITLETFSRAWSWLGEAGLQPEATSLQLAHSRPLGSLHCLEPEHPIFLLRVKR